MRSLPDPGSPAGKRISRPYLLFHFFQDLALVYPVYVIYFRAVGLSHAEVATLLVIWGVAVIVVEIPGGVLADIWSRRASIAIGLVCKAAAFIVWMARPDFIGFALGFVLWGVQEGICTGTVEALLYDALHSADAEEHFVALSGRAVFVGRIAVIASVLLGAALFPVAPVAVFVVSAASMVFAAGSVAFIRESRGEHSSETGRERAADGAGEGLSRIRKLREQLCAIRESVQAAWLIPGFAGVVLFGSLATVVYGVLDEYDALFALEEVGLPLAGVGVWSAFRFLSEGVGAELAARMRLRFHLDSPVRLAVLMIIAGTAMVVATASDRSLLLAFYFLFFFLLSMSEVIFRGWVQDRIASQGRATLSSMVSFVYETFGLLILVVSGTVGEVFGTGAIFLAGGMLVVLSAAAFAAAGTSAAAIRGARE